ncbi:MAG: DUF4129 domain-containing protein [Oscillospiraceae bacterium]|nr:DUF4129 domain-containing protein [Oscillospiraceae bacterium]
MKAVTWEWALCVMAASALNFSVMRSVYIPDALMERILPVALLCALWQTCLFLSAYSKRALRAALVTAAIVAAALGIVIAAGIFRPGGLSLYVLLTAVSSAAVFLLTRRRGGAAALFVAGAIALGAMSFLQYGSSRLCLAVFILSSACLFVRRGYRFKTRATTWPTALASVCVCALALALAGAVFRFVVAPIVPPARDVKLITRLMTLPLLEQLGVSSHIYLLDPDRTSEAKNEDQMISDEEATARDEQPEHSGTSAPEKPEQAQSGAFGAPAAIASAVSYFFKDYRWLAIPIVPIVVLCAAILLKRLQRKLRLRALCTGSNALCVARLYGCFVEKLPFAGLPPIEDDTPKEYCARLGERAGIFPAAEFSELTDVFCRAVYGGYEPQNGERELFIRFYGELPAVCRGIAGNFRYAARFFRL